MGPAPTPGAALLLLLWLKREAKKALQGEGKGLLWDVQGSFEQMIKAEFSQLKQARSQIRKARTGARVV